MQAFPRDLLVLFPVRVGGAHLVSAFSLLQLFCRKTDEGRHCCHFIFNFTLWEPRGKSGTTITSGSSWSYGFQDFYQSLAALQDCLPRTDSTPDILYHLKFWWLNAPWWSCWSAGWNGGTVFQLVHQTLTPAPPSSLQEHSRGSLGTKQWAVWTVETDLSTASLSQNLISWCVHPQHQSSCQEAWWLNKEASADDVWWQVLVGWGRSRFSRVSLGSLGPLDSLVEKSSVPEKCHTLYSLVDSSCSLAQ